MILNNATCLNHRNQFLKDFKIIFSYCTNSAPCITSELRKKAGVQFKRNNVLRNEN